MRRGTVRILLATGLALLASAAGPLNTNSKPWPMAVA